MEVSELDLLRPWPESSAWVLDCTDPWLVPVRTQRRAINLIATLHEAGVSEFVVVGGGLGGLTAAAAALEVSDAVRWVHGREDPLWMLEDDPGALHPRLFEWPEPGWDRPDAGLPVADWSTGGASAVLARLRVASKRLGPIQRQAEAIELTETGLAIGAGKRKEQLSGGVVLAAPLHHIAASLGVGQGRVLVSGDTDEALVQLLREVIPGFGPGLLVRELAGPLRSLAEQLRDTPPSRETFAGLSSELDAWLRARAQKGRVFNGAIGSSQVPLLQLLATRLLRLGLIEERRGAIDLAVGKAQVEVNFLQEARGSSHQSFDRVVSWTPEWRVSEPLLEPWLPDVLRARRAGLALSRRLGVSLERRFPPAEIPVVEAEAPQEATSLWAGAATGLGVAGGLLAGAGIAADRGPLGYLPAALALAAAAWLGRQPEPSTAVERPLGRALGALAALFALIVLIWAGHMPEPPPADAGVELTDGDAELTDGDAELTDGALTDGAPAEAGRPHDAGQHLDGGRPSPDVGRHALDLGPPDAPAQQPGWLERGRQALRKHDLTRARAVQASMPEGDQRETLAGLIDKEAAAQRKVARQLRRERGRERWRAALKRVPLLDPVVHEKSLVLLAFSLAKAVASAARHGGDEGLHESLRDLAPLTRALRPGRGSVGARRRLARALRQLALRILRQVNAHGRLPEAERLERATRYLDEANRLDRDTDGEREERCRAHLSYEMARGEHPDLKPLEGSAAACREPGRQTP